MRLPLPKGLPGAADLLAGIRPEDVELSESPLPGAWEAALELAEPLGASVLLTLRVGGSRVRALATGRGWPPRLWVRWPPERIHWFDATTERRVDRERVERA